MSTKTKESCGGGFRFPGCEDWIHRDFEVPTPSPGLQFGPVTGFGTGTTNDGVGPVYLPPAPTGSIDELATPKPVTSTQETVGGAFSGMARVRDSVLSVLSPSGNPSPAAVAVASLLPLGLVALGAWWIYKRLSR